MYAYALFQNVFSYINSSFVHYLTPHTVTHLFLSSVRSQEHFILHYFHYRRTKSQRISVTFPWLQETHLVMGRARACIEVIQRLSIFKTNMLLPPEHYWLNFLKIQFREIFKDDLSNSGWASLTGWKNRHHLHGKNIGFKVLEQRWLK